MLAPEEIDQLPMYTWLSLRSAIDATRTIMSKAPSAQLSATLETIDMLKETPMYSTDEVYPDEEAKGKTDEGSNKKDNPPKPTHINLFMWLRVMLRQFQEDQNTRTAAVRLMFEAAAVGALTPQLHALSQMHGRCVEFPQFQAICESLLPALSVTEYASLFGKCYDEGKRKVSSDVFLRVADQNNCFAKTLNLESYPLLTPEDYAFPRHQSTSTTQNDVVSKLSSSILKSVRSHQDSIVTKIHSLVHRKLTVMTPELNNVSNYLPEKWRKLLKMSRERVRTSLNESLVRIMRRCVHIVMHIYIHVHT